MKFNQDLYQKILPDLVKKIQRAKHEKIEQYIFTGHSLGGAMASLAVFDFVQNNIIPKTKVSPVLITYGQPRVGNYAFANELMKSVPIVYRIVNIYDIVSGIPACILDKKKNCTNEYLKSEIDLNFLDYAKNKLKIKKGLREKFYPWHIGGLVYNKLENAVELCKISEPKIGSKCKLETSLNTEYHGNFYGFRMSSITNPKIFKYDMLPDPDPDLEFSNKDLETEFKGPKPFIMKKINNNFVNGILPKTGIINKKK